MTLVIGRKWYLYLKEGFNCGLVASWRIKRDGSGNGVVVVANRWSLQCCGKGSDSNGVVSRGDFTEGIWIRGFDSEELYKVGWCDDAISRWRCNTIDQKGADHRNDVGEEEMDLLWTGDNCFVAAK
jgi:hypothetical protein